MRRFFRGRADADIERQLRADRPAPRPEVLGAISSRIVGTRAATPQRSAARYGIAIAVVLAFVGALASLGALSSAQKSAAGTASATANAIEQVVSKPTSRSTDSVIVGTKTVTTAPSSTASAGSTGASNVAGGAVAPATDGTSAAQTRPAVLANPAVLDLPTMRFLAAVETYAANQWLCHFKGHPATAPGQWEVVQMTSEAIFLAHATHPDDTGPHATEPSKQDCVDFAT